MKLHDVINEADLRKLNQEVSGWITFTAQLRKDVVELSSAIEAGKQLENLRHQFLSEMLMAQFFTFSSIQILISKRHSVDAFSLLRTLFEGQLHIWHLCRCTDVELKQFSALAAVQDWRIAQEALTIDSETIRQMYYSDERLSDLKQSYEASLKVLNSRPGKTPRNYRTKSITKIAKEIDDTEDTSLLMQWMNLRLYSAGSEYIHRSHFALREGFGIVQHDDKWVLAPHLFRSVEAAWWSSTIILYCLKWIAKHIDVQIAINEKIDEVHKRSALTMNNLKRKST